AKVRNDGLVGASREVEISRMTGRFVWRADHGRTFLQHAHLRSVAGGAERQLFRKFTFAEQWIAELIEVIGVFLADQSATFGVPLTGNPLCGVLRGDGLDFGLLAVGPLPSDVFDQSAAGANVVDVRTRAARSLRRVRMYARLIHPNRFAAGDAGRAGAVNG